MSKHQSQAEERAEIDLTPMLDVVFIMLIFFIVTAAFLKERSLPVNTPEGKGESDAGAAMVFQVNANDEVFLEGRRVDLQSVRSLVARQRAEMPESAVVVVASGEASTHTYVAIADAARQAKVASVSLVPKG